jgi:6-phosphogluconolactonase (cycloisomerase 2 family)
MAKEVTTTVKPGSGPRHIVASPFDAHTLYGTNELNGEINRYKIQNDGTLTLEQSFSANPT